MGCTPLPAHGAPASITDYITREPGIVVVPDGQYAGGTVRTRHDDWLVLVAEHPGQVVVTSPLELRAPTSKVAFVGFAFETMVSALGTDDVVFWYGRATNPARSPSGDRPTFLWAAADSTAGNRHARGVRVAGMDISDIGDDGIQIGGAGDVTVEGVKISGVSNHGINTDRWHNDAIQWTGGDTAFRVAASDLGGHVQVGQDFGPLTDVVLEDFWLHDSPNAGVIYDAASWPATLTGSRARGYSWGHAIGDRLDFAQGRSGPPGSTPRVRVDDTGVVQGPPPAGTPNPADVWRQAHPYGSWAAYLGLSLPRRAGLDRYGTAAVLATTAFPDGAAQVVVARGDDFADALAAAYPAGATGGPVLLADPAANGNALADAARKLGASRALLVGGSAAVSDRTASALTSAGIAVSRAAGADRVETAAVAATSPGADAVGSLKGAGRTALLTSASGFADALAAGVVAYDGRFPLLLATADGVPPATVDALRQLDIDHVVLVGGSAALPDAVADGVRGEGITVERVAGRDRYETAVALADFGRDRLGWRASEAVLVSGNEFADGLAGAAAAARAGPAPLLLVGDELGPATEDWLAANRGTAVEAFGGPAAVSDTVLASAISAAR